MANPFDQFDTVGSNAFDQFDEAPVAASIAPKVEVPKEQPKTLFGNAVIPALMESLTRSEPSVAEPGFMGAAKDVALGVPEAIAGLTSGLGAFIGGQVASVPTALTAMLPQGEKDKFDVTRGLAEGQKVAEKISTAGTYHPTTDTGKLLMKPIDVVFGTLLGSVENTVRQLADPTVPKEEVDKRVQASQYVTNSLLLGLPLLKGKLEKGKSLTVEDFKDAEKALPAETPPDVAAAALDALRNFNIKEAVASNVKTKFEGNQSIAEGLMTEALKREGHAKGALNRVAKIVSDLEGDVSGVDFKGMKGVGPKSKALIEKLVKERDSITEPKIEKTIVLPETGKKLEPTGTGIPTSEMDTPGIELDRFEQSIPAEDQAIMADVFKNIRDNKLHEKGSFPQQLFNMVGGIYENRTGKKLEILGGVNKPEITLPNKLSEAVDKPNQVKTLEQMGVTEPSAQVDAIIRDAVTQKLDLANGLDARGKVEAADKVRQEGLDNAKKLTTADGPVTEALVQKVVNEKTAKPFPELPSEKIISEFDNTSLAKGEGYEIKDKRRFDSIDSAQKVADRKGEGNEVIKIGDKYAVGKFVETEIPEYPSMEALKMDLEVMSEIPYSKAKIEAEQPEGSEFWVAKVGDKYYRTVVKDPNAPVREAVPTTVETKAPVEISTELEPTSEALRAEEVQLKKDLKALVKESKKVDTPKETIRPAIADAFKRYKERYVEKINVAKEVPVTSKDLPVIDSNFATFKSEAEGLTYKEATGKKGELIQDPLSKEWFIEPELEGFEDLGWEDGVESLTSHRRDRLSDETLDYGEMSEDGTRDLFSIFSNERGAVDITPLRIAVDKMEQVVEASKKAGKSIDEFLDMIGMSPEAIFQFKTALAQMPKDKETLRDLDPIIEGILHPQDEILYQTVKRNKLGEVVSKMPPLTKKLAKRLYESDKSQAWGKQATVTDSITGRVYTRHTMGPFSKYMQETSTRIRDFTAVGLKDEYRYWRDSLDNKRIETENLYKQLDTLKDTFTSKEVADLSMASYVDMISGKEAFEGMGIDPSTIPTMNVKQMETFKTLNKLASSLRERANYVRVNTGQKPIPKLLDVNGNENYLPMIRQMNVLREMGLVDSIVSTNTSRLAEIAKNFNGLRNPHTKSRNISNIPIELDVFKAMEHYIDYTLKDIYVAPIAALMHEIVNARIPVEGSRRSIKLKDHNPALATMVDAWKDEIMGNDVVAQSLLAKHPGVHKAAVALSKNIPAAMIGGSLRTVVVQVTSLLGTAANVGLHYALYGIARLLVERPFKGKQGRAWREGKILDLRQPDIAMSEAIDLIQQGVLKGARATATELAYMGMRWTDSLTAEASWNAGYKYAERVLKYDKKKAGQFADDLVDTTQGLGIKGATAPIQASIATRWIALLGTFQIADFNVITRDLLGIKNPDVNNKVQVRKVLTYFIVGTMIGELYKSIGIDNVFPDPIGEFQAAKEEGKGDATALMMASKEFLEKLPLLGGTIKYGSSMFGVVGEWGTDTGSAIREAGNILDWNNMTKRERLKYALLMGSAIGLTMGIPFTGQLVKSFRTAYKGGNPYEIIMGIYIDEQKKKGGTPNLKLESPSLKVPKGL